MLHQTLCLFANAKFDRLVIVPPAVFKPMGKSHAIAATPARIAPRTAAPYALFHQVDGPVRLLAVEELLDHGLQSWDSGRASHKHQVMHVLLLDASVSQALYHEVHGNIDGAFQGTWPAPPYSPANCWGRRTARVR